MNKSVAVKIAETAVMSALLIIGKFVLAFIPNVEVVTLFIFVFVATKGLVQTLLSVFVFAICNNFLYPTTLSVAILYITFYPFATVIVFVFSRAFKNNIFLATLAVLLGVVFWLYSCVLDYFIIGIPLAPAIVSGVIFMAINVFSNFIIILFLYEPLCKVILRTQRNYKL